MQPFSAPLISNLLLPNGHEGAVISLVRVDGWESSAVKHIGRLLALRAGFIVGPGAFMCHFPRRGRSAGKDWYERAISQVLLLWSQTLLLE
jgi:hypothetical protein